MERLSKQEDRKAGIGSAARRRQFFELRVFSSAIMRVKNIDLVPPLVEAGKFHELAQAGQTISASLSPYNNSLAVHIAPLEPSSSKPSAIVQEEALYFASYDDIPSSERRLVSQFCYSDKTSLSSQ